MRHIRKLFFCLLLTGSVFFASTSIVQAQTVEKEGGTLGEGIGTVVDAPAAPEAADAPAAPEAAEPESSALPGEELPQATEEAAPSEATETEGLAPAMAGTPKPIESPVRTVPAPEPVAEQDKPADVMAVTNGQGHEEYVPGQGWRFYDMNKGQYATGFYKLPDGRTVYYGADNIMVFGSTTINGLPYTFATNGNMENSGEVFLPGRGWAYLDRATADYVKGFFTLPDGRRVYYGGDYAMKTGLQTINGLPYSFDTGNGKLVNYGENYVPGKGWAYLSPQTMDYVTGITQLPDGRKVLYGDDKIMKFGEIVWQNTSYRTDAANGSICTGELFFAGRGWTYLDPNTYTYAKGVYGLPDGRWVLYNAGNLMQFGEVMWEGLPYRLDNSTGNMATGELLFSNYGWMYMNPTTHAYVKGIFTLPDSRIVYYGGNATMQFNEQSVDGKWYYFSPSTGNMALGFFTLPDARTVYYDRNKGMLFGEQNLSQKWYYFNPGDGTLMLGFIYLPDGRTVYYDSNQGMLYGWQKVKSVLYKFDAVNGNLLYDPHNLNKTLITVYDINSKRQVTSSLYEILTQIVANELGNGQNIEAYKAQAVAAQSWLLYNYYIYGSTAPRVGLKPATSAALQAAVTQTNGQYLTYNGNPILAMYGASTGGVTNSALAYFNRSDLAYLSAIPDPYGITRQNQVSTWTLQSMSDAIYKMTGSRPTGSPETWVQINGLGGYITGATVNGKFVTASTFFDNMWGLYSPYISSFTYNSSNKVWTAHTSGNGHGLGLSQTGAMYYANAGWSYQQILSYYYHDTALV